MRVLVTGNLGYIGSVLTRVLREGGHEIRGLDPGFFADCVWGPRDGLDAGVQGQHRIDARDAPPSVFSGVDAVLHLAALSNDPLGELDPRLTEEINHRQTVRFARMAKEAGVERFVFASSCSVYGRGAARTVDETSPVDPLTAYARSKAAAEEDLRRLADDRFTPVLLRNATAYGPSPRMRFDLAVNNLLACALATGEARLTGDGSAWRPFAHVEDVAQAFLAAMEAPAEEVRGEAFNVGRDSDNRRIREVAQAVADVVPGCRVEFAPGAGADARSYRVSFRKVREELPGFRPIWTLERGIRDLLEHARRIGGGPPDPGARAFTRLGQLRHLREGGAIGADLRWTQDPALPVPPPLSGLGSR